MMPSKQPPIPVPGCTCPPSYVRDVCKGHPEPGCPFKGMFGLVLAQAHWEATWPATPWPGLAPRVGQQLDLFDQPRQEV